MNAAERPNVPIARLDGRALRLAAVGHALQVRRRPSSRSKQTNAKPYQNPGRRSGPHQQICATLIETVGECGVVTEEAAAPIAVGEKYGGGLRPAGLL